jgi:hypothetical protein
VARGLLNWANVNPSLKQHHCVGVPEAVRVAIWNFRRGKHGLQFAGELARDGSFIADARPKKIRGLVVRYREQFQCNFLGMLLPRRLTSSLPARPIAPLRVFPRRSQHELQLPADCLRCFPPPFLLSGGNTDLVKLLPSNLILSARRRHSSNSKGCQWRRLAESL